MAKICIELNNVVRDINSQVLKYYKKDINKSFDSSNVDTNVLNIIDSLDFNEKKGKYNFMYIDYPYEIFGCAKPMHKNLPVMINNFLVHLTDIGNSDEDVSFFSLKESALTIQSSYFFLSKIGSRIRNVIFPINGATLWDKFDVIITTNENIINNKPNGKVAVLIKKTDNEKLVEKSDLIYDSLFDILSDDDFLKKVDFSLKTSCKTNKFINKLKKIFK